VISTDCTETQGTALIFQLHLQPGFRTTERHIGQI